MSANFSLFAGIYYVGRVIPAALFDIYIFLLFPVVFISGYIYKNLPFQKMRILFIFLFFIVFIVFPAYERNEYITENITARLQKYTQGKIFLPEFDEQLNSHFKQEIPLIKNQIKENEVAILSSDDTFLLQLSEKENLIDANPQSAIDFKSEMTPALANVTKICPSKIVADCMIFKKCPDHRPFSHFFSVAPFILTEIEEKCHIKYEPTICTDQICIAKSRI